MATMIDTGEFALGTPALVCRWRLAGGRLVMQGRHLRALAARTVDDAPVAAGLVAWVSQHVEWTLEAGSTEHPDGVLMLIVDDRGHAAMTVGAYEPLPNTSLTSLVERARDAAREREQTGIAPETLWVVNGRKLLWNGVPGEPSSGSATLVNDLARTMGYQVIRRRDLLDELTRGLTAYDEAFLVSDEHGIVPASDHDGSCAARFADGYARLLAATTKRVLLSEPRLKKPTQI